MALEGGGATTEAQSNNSGAAGLEKNVNMALNEIAMQNSCVPEWNLISESGPQHQKVKDIISRFPAHSYHSEVYMAIIHGTIHYNWDRPQ